MTRGRHYLPGGLAVVPADLLLVAWVPTERSPSAVEMWALFAAGGSPIDALMTLGRDGLADLPEFAVVSLEGPVLRTFVRGGVELRVENRAPTFLSGEGYATWREDHWTDVHRVTVRRSGANQAEGTALLPIAEGVIWAEVFEWEVPQLPPAPTPVPASAGVAQTDPGIEVMTGEALHGSNESVPAPRPTAAAPGAERDPALDPARIFLEGRHEPVPECVEAASSGIPPGAFAPPAPNVGTQVPPIPPAPPAPTAPPSTGGPVRVAICARGHINPEDGFHCRACGESLRAAPRTWVDSIVLGVLRSPEGVVHVIDGPLILGREPGPPGYVNGARPRWCQVGGPGYEVSRSHLEVRVDGWTVSVVDLDSTNGTEMVAPDGTAYLLAPQVPAVLVPGWSIRLAELETLRYEVQ